MKLIIHIGAGKTGTTSIQSNLNLNKELLYKHKSIYCGMYFENVEGHDLKGGAFERFSNDFYKSHADFKNTVVSSIRKLKEICVRDGIENVVWVNESLYESPFLIKEALDSCSDVVDSVEIIFYMRRQDRWLKSAYQQWGIKHKVYGGVVRSFESWLPLMLSKIDYKTLISNWNTFIDKQHITLVVYEKCKQGVVADFFKRIGIEIGVNVDDKRSNESLGYYQLVLFKLYNSLFVGGKLPDDMSRFISRLNIDKLDVPEINADVELPNNEMLRKIQSTFDNEGLEKYTNSSSSIKFDEEDIGISKQDSVNRDSLVAVLLYAMVGMEKRITILERKLKESERHG